VASAIVISPHSSARRCSAGVFIIQSSVSRFGSVIFLFSDLLFV
jgi:hypothetical protein